MKARKFHVLVGIFVLLGFVSCRDEITNQVDVPDEITTTVGEKQLCEAGWSEFESGNFNAADNTSLNLFVCGHRP